MPNIKYSGFKWIGKIPVDWNIERLQWHIREINIKNKPIKTNNILSLTNKLGVVPYEEKGNQGNKSKENYSEYKIAFKDTIVANSMNILIGSVGYCNYFGCVSPVYYVFKELDGSNLRFINYIMQTNEFQKELRKYANGILEIRLRVSADDILKRFVAIPSLNVQNKIVKFLDEKCEKISSILNEIQKQIDILEEYKKSLITEVVTKGLNSNVVMKNSGIAWNPIIPSHWNVINPKALFKLRTQRAYKNDEQLTASQKYGIISQKKFMEIENQKVVTVEKDFDILKHVEPNDFVISMRSFQGGLEYSEVRGCISSAYVMLIPVENKVYPPFYKWFFKSSKYINAIQSTSNLIRDGQAMRYANFVQVKLFDIPFSEQKEIAKYLNSVVSQIDNSLLEKQKQFETLEEYKKSLIYEYVTGKKEVV